MDYRKDEEVSTQSVESTVPAQLHVLNDLQLALVGGGIGETIL